MDTLKEATGTLPDKFSGDNGYMSEITLSLFLKATDLDACIATNMGEKKNKIPLGKSNRRLRKTDFVFNGQVDFLPVPVDKC